MKEDYEVSIEEAMTVEPKESDAYLMQLLSAKSQDKKKDIIRNYMRARIPELLQEPGNGFTRSEEEMMQKLENEFRTEEFNNWLNDVTKDDKPTKATAALLRGSAGPVFSIAMMVLEPEAVPHREDFFRKSFYPTVNRQTSSYYSNQCESIRRDDEKVIDEIAEKLGKTKKTSKKKETSKAETKKETKKDVIIDTSDSKSIFSDLDSEPVDAPKKKPVKGDKKMRNLYKHLDNVDPFWMTKSSGEFRALKASLKTLKDFTESNFTSQKGYEKLGSREKKEEYINLLKDVKEKAEAYFARKRREFKETPGRRNDLGKQEWEQPRIVAVMNVMTEVVNRISDAASIDQVVDNMGGREEDARLRSRFMANSKDANCKPQLMKDLYSTASKIQTGYNPLDPNLLRDYQQELKDYQKLRKMEEKTLEEAVKNPTRLNEGKKVAPKPM